MPSRRAADGRGRQALGTGVDFDVPPTVPTSTDAGQQVQHLVERQDFPVLGRDDVDHVVRRANEARARAHMQRIVLAQVASGTMEMTSQATVRAVSEELGASVPAPGIRKALLSLPADVLSNPRRGVYVIVDPLFASWLRSRRAGV